MLVNTFKANILAKGGGGLVIFHFFAPPPPSAAATAAPETAGILLRRVIPAHFVHRRIDIGQCEQRIGPPGRILIAPQQGAGIFIRIEEEKLVRKGNQRLPAHRGIGDLRLPRSHPS